jgi:hypothetical protein
MATVLALIAIEVLVVAPHFGRNPVAQTSGRAAPPASRSSGDSPGSVYVGRKPSARQDTAVIGAAGDIACPSLNRAGWSDEELRDYRNSCRYPATADLLAALHPDAVLPLGDNQYPDGALASYRSAYNSTWGKLKMITYPVVGNHEYGSPGAHGFFAYFASVLGSNHEGYYSYDLGSWHVIALNSECTQPDIGGCQAGSDEERWLKADLAAHPAACTLAYWHQPRFSSGNHGSNTDYRAFWEDLYAAGVDVVLNGHDHDYERFQPLRPDGRIDPAQGITEFVVGTGGASLSRFHGRELGSAVQVSGMYGVLGLTLGPGQFSWKFLSASEQPSPDGGSARCH